MALAFVFPGQGSQSIGMMNGWADLAVVKATFDEASAILGEDLWQMVADGPAELLNATINTQPLMLTAGVAVWRAWQAQGGVQPEVLAGHSLGEYTALVAAEALSFGDALQLVRLRATAMQDAVPAGTGAMAAILGLADDQIIAACEEVAQGEVVAAVNFNSPGQVVIAGSKAAVERACEACKARGAKRAMLLPVSVPSHCALMRPAAEKLQQKLDTIVINTPVIPVLHNADVAAYSDAAQIKDALVRQLYEPVRWVETITKMANDGITVIAECGPGKVLAGLNKRIATEAQQVALVDAAALQTLKAML
ncbi:ACP S-malonyltransferase [Iodobacter fluviatilis]|uniref:Malonyl CoA-acyl carrier protein transacylase n=1 Tax=Iodobacter fluviatilis TaxID=537 RepID=A0A377SVC3_9NEIS|nr:ACP S-malonyltransferase [Iodobacter fluviatilis]TCU85046.1 [acyl-carrier-protein] S-malonyltransferase [Iodobacter fluviatilis]STR45270.1 Malonyl CoA-acyl carrier protein transacylase [Iodobacter fluviatilis]